VLRAALFAVGGALLIGAAALALAGCGFGVALRLAVPSAVLLLALCVERWRYKPLRTRRPGAGWVATGERFVDPESGRLVSVFYKPATGERRYVAL
jgi:hypothetical protein